MSKFLQSAAFLAICNLIAKLIGAFFKVPLTNILGAEGMGIYQLVFPVYTVLLAISGGGLPQAVSRMVSRSYAAGDTVSAHRVLVVCLFMLTAIGGVGSLTLLLLGGFIAGLQGNAGATAAYWALSPSVLFVCIMSVFRGYFQGKQNMFPTAVSQLVEQAVKLFAGLFFAYALLGMGLVSGVAGALVGVSISEAAAFGIIGIMYLVSRKKRVANVICTAAHSLTVGQIAREIYKTAIPISLGALVMPMSQLIDSVLIVNILKLSGETTAGATTLYGIVTAPIGTLINLPTVVSAALAVSIIPRLAKGDRHATISSYLRLAALAGSAGFVGLLVFGDDCLNVLYGSLGADQLAVAYPLLRIMSGSVFFISMAQVIGAVMQALGKPHIPAISMLIGAFIKAALTAVLVYYTGIGGSVIASTVCYALTFALDAVILYKVTGEHYFKAVSLPVVCSLIAAACSAFAKYLMRDTGSWLILFVGGTVFAAVFFAVAKMLRVIPKKITEQKIK